LSPAECIASLDRAIAEDGEDIVIRRVTGTGSNTSNADVTVRAKVMPFRPIETIGTIQQSDSNVIFSPSEILRAQWPGAQLVPPAAPSFLPDPRIPKANTDKAIIQGKVRNITFVKPIYVDGMWARCEMTVAG
jgi:hypothetical protein